MSCEEWSTNKKNRILKKSPKVDNGFISEISMSNDFLIQFEKAVKKFKSEIRDQRLNPYNFRLFEQNFFLENFLNFQKS